MRTESELRDVLAGLNIADEAWAAAQRNRTAGTAVVLSHLHAIHDARSAICWALGDAMMPSLVGILRGPTTSETDE